MGKYSGILICTDFDGTLYDGRKIPENNVQAIREFREGGGLFSVISGRLPIFFREFFENYKFGVPVGALNGAIVYDADNQAVVRDSFMEGLTPDFAKRCLAVAKDSINAIFFSFERELRIPSSSPELITEELCKNSYKYLVELPRNVSKEVSEEYFRAIAEVVGDRYTLVRSSYHLVEILDKRLTKASTALFLKEYTGSHTLICVGDFENDLDMIKAADIGYAVANAEEGVKPEADKVTVSARDGAIASIIRDLDVEECKV
jgi:HAD superfamily hydrolase (TIGR01484 family)